MFSVSTMITLIIGMLLHFYSAFNTKVLFTVTLLRVFSDIGGLLYRQVVDPATFRAAFVDLTKTLTALSFPCFVAEWGQFISV